MQKDYLERVYAGFLGMNVGIRLGAPIESTLWTYERIKETYGDIRGYVKQYRNFAADDDVNGPVYFFRALDDSSRSGELRPEYVAKAWLNYTRRGVGMFWWGGYGISTEHTAYLNLLHQIPAPRSGSAEVNGKVLSEQIGGQIFIDTWGLIWPGRPEKAAEYARTAASVSHDGEGLHGAAFIAAAIAAAFTEREIGRVVERALEELPPDCLYAQAARAVLRHYRKFPDSWESCLNMLHQNWGYDQFGGVCHIIPNGGVCVLALLYGNGDFCRCVEIAAMCGWDTDCNAGNVGTIAGVFSGLDGIPKHYRDPINDGVVLSGISGYLNILDLPTFSRELARTGYLLAGECPPPEVEVRRGELCFDFELPGSTHNFRTSDPYLFPLAHSRKRAFRGNGSLEILVDRAAGGRQGRIYYKPFYTRADFSDERYSPVFTPQVSSGQQMEMWVYFDQWTGGEGILVSPYFRTASDQKLHSHGFHHLEPAKWRRLSCQIEDTCGDLIDEAGLLIKGGGLSSEKELGKLYLDEFRVFGAAEYTLDMGKQRRELSTVTPFAVNGGAWEIAGDALNLMCCEPAAAYSGNYYAGDIRLSLNVTPHHGDGAALFLRARGAFQSYMAVFQSGKAEIWKQDFGVARLASAPFPLSPGRDYEITFQAQGDRLTLMADGTALLYAEDGAFRHGMWGLGAQAVFRGSFREIRVKEL